MPLWVVAHLRTACQSCAFSRGLPFHAGTLLEELDQLQGQRDCLRGTGLTLRSLCDFLRLERWADVEVRPNGPWVTGVHVPPR